LTLAAPAALVFAARAALLVSFLRVPPALFAPLASVAALRLHRLDGGGGTKLPRPLRRCRALLLRCLLLHFLLLPDSLLRGLLLSRRILALHFLLMRSPLLLDLLLRVHPLVALHAILDYLPIAASPFLLLQAQLIELLAALLVARPTLLLLPSFTALLLPHLRLAARDTDQ
jgi:hypothetical protein